MLIYSLPLTSPMKGKTLHLETSVSYCMCEFYSYVKVGLASFRKALITSNIPLDQKLAKHPQIWIPDIVYVIYGFDLYFCLFFGFDF